MVATFRKLLVVVLVVAALVAAAGACAGADSDHGAPSAGPSGSVAAVATPSTMVLGSALDADAWSAWWDGTPGPSAPACVDVDAISESHQWTELIGADGVPSTERDGEPTRVLDVRSGGLVAGNFSSPGGAGSPGSSDFSMKIYWVPRDPSLARTEPLTVTVTDLHGSLPDTVVTFPPGASTTAPGEEPARYFWPSGVPLPGAGRWRLTAAATGVSGCFEFTL